MLISSYIGPPDEATGVPSSSSLVLLDLALGHAERDLHLCLPTTVERATVVSGWDLLLRDGRN